MPKLDEVQAYAQGLSQRVKSYIDMMLAPFLRTRVQIYIVKVISFDKKKETMVVELNGVKFTALIGANKPPNIKRFPYARVLYDSRTHVMYYDDVVATKFARR